MANLDDILCSTYLKSSNILKEDTSPEVSAAYSIIRSLSLFRYWSEAYIKTHKTGQVKGVLLNLFDEYVSNFKKEFEQNFLKESSNPNSIDNKPVEEKQEELSATIEKLASLEASNDQEEQKIEKEADAIESKTGKDPFEDDAPDEEIQNNIPSSENNTPAEVENLELLKDVFARSVSVIDYFKSIVKNYVADNEIDTMKSPKHFTELSNKDANFKKIHDKVMDTFNNIIRFSKSPTYSPDTLSEELRRDYNFSEEDIKYILLGIDNFIKNTDPNKKSHIPEFVGNKPKFMRDQEKSIKKTVESEYLEEIDSTVEDIMFDKLGLEPIQDDNYRFI